VQARVQVMVDLGVLRQAHAMRDSPRAERFGFPETLVVRETGVVESELQLVVRGRLDEQELGASTLESGIRGIDFKANVRPQRLDGGRRRSQSGSSSSLWKNRSWRASSPTSCDIGLSCRPERGSNRLRTRSRTCDGWECGHPAIRLPL
jgi:hypothetical protein